MNTSVAKTKYPLIPNNNSEPRNYVHEKVKGD